MSIVFSEFKLNTFLSALKIVQSGCEDLMIKGGKIRQSSTDRRTIYDCDLSNIIGSIDLNISKFGEKREILELFSKQKTTVTLDITPTKYIFSNGRSSLELFNLNSSVEQYLTNKYLNDAEFEKQLGIDSLQKVRENTDVIDKCEFDLLLGTAKSFSTGSLILDFVDDSVDIKISPSDEKNSTIVSIVKYEGLDIPVKGICKFNLYSFYSCYPPLSLNYYMREHNNNTLMYLKVSSIIGQNDFKQKKKTDDDSDDKVVVNTDSLANIKVWCGSNLVKPK